MPDQGGNRNSPATDFEVELALGKVPGGSQFHRFAHGSSMSSAGDVATTIWPLDSSIPQYIYPQSAATLSVVSASTNDSATGTGARKVTVTGLDSAFLDISEEVTMTGASSVGTTNSFFRVNFALVTEIGTYGGSNLGDITITHTSSGHTVSFIGTGDGESHIAVFSIAAGKTGLMRALHFFPQEEKTGTGFQYCTRAAGNITDTTEGAMQPFVIESDIFDEIRPVDIEFHAELVLPATTDVELRSINQGGAGAAQKAGVEFEIFEFDV